MDNRYFEPDHLRVLGRPERWRLIHPGWGALPAARTDGAWRTWYERHRSRHAHLEVMIALRGMSVYGVGEAACPAVPGSIFIFPPFAIHQNGYPDDTPDLDHLWLSVAGDRFTACLLRFQGRRRIPLRLDAVSSGAQAGISLAGESFGLGEDPVPVRRLRTFATVCAMTLTLVERGRRAEPEGGEKEFQREVIQAVCRHLDDTAGRGASLDTLARIAGYSKYHFHRLFQEETGMTAHGYINQCRRNRARLQEARGEAKSAIARELGFSSSAAYSRWRRRHLEA